MKKTLITMVAIIASFSGLMAQSKMLVNLKSGATVEYSVSDVESVTWETGGQHEYVDLGLPSGLKWATCNVGASAPEEYGDYYAWGEIETKDTYLPETYMYCTLTIPGHPAYTDEDGFEVAATEDYYEYTDLGNISGTQYDVAHMKWGGSWHMPTYDEIYELRKKCTWTWQKKNNVYGYKVEGPNGNWIFLPAAGYREGTELCKQDIRGLYWSTDIVQMMDGNQYIYDTVYILRFDSQEIFPYRNGMGSSRNPRYVGISVRPVKE